MIKAGKFNIIMDGQFGSTGKGVISSYVSISNHVDLTITNAAPNAGHTFYWDNKKFVLKHLTVSGIINKRSVIYLCAGTIIDPDILLWEIEEYGVDHNRIFIHPRCAVITENDKKNEGSGSAAEGLSSTQSGVGMALSRKINRESRLAMDIPELQRYIRDIDLHEYMDMGLSVLMEVPQGLGLSINSGYAYPYCTSREITVSAAMSDAQVHPSYLGNVIVSLRSYPIRVGNLMVDGEQVGYSGPFYPDSGELSWDELGLPKEYTTNTNRVRRVATFSEEQYNYMIRQCKPDYVFLNFANYLTDNDILNIVREHQHITHLGFGPTMDDILTVDEFFIDRRI